VWEGATKQSLSAGFSNHKIIDPSDLEMSGWCFFAFSAPLLVRVPMKDRKLFPASGFI